MRQGKVVVARCGDITILDEREMEMAIEAFLHLADIFHLSDSAHRNLFTLVNVGNWATHGLNWYTCNLIDFLKW